MASSGSGTRLVAMTDEERATLLTRADVIERHGGRADLLRSLADRYEDGLDSAEAHEVSNMFISHWNREEIDPGHPLYTGYLKLRQISDEQHSRYSEPSANYHDLADRLLRSLSQGDSESEGTYG